MTPAILINVAVNAALASIYFAIGREPVAAAGFALLASLSAGVATDLILRMPR